VKAPDTSVLVAGFDSTHPFHEPAQQTLAEVRRSGRLIAHTLAETFAVLTAAGPYGFRPAPVVTYLGAFLDRDPIALGPAAYARAVVEIGRFGVLGGAIYDALIALAAQEGGALLVSLDRRASATYRRCEADFELILN